MKSLASSLWYKRLAVIVALGLAACQPLMAPPPPTPQTVHIQLTPSLSELRQDLHICAAVEPAIGLRIDESPAPSLSVDNSDLALRLGYPVGFDGFAAIAGWETIAVVVHPTNPAARLDASTLKDIFSGKIKHWGDLPGPSAGAGREIAVWSYSKGDDTREALEPALFGGEASITGLAHQAPSPEAMRQAIADDPDAIGYLPAHWLNDQVQAVKMDDSLNAELRIPVISLSKKEPQGPARQLLGCINKGK